MHRLSSSTVRAAIKPGMYPDGAGLYLLVSPTGGKSWIYRFGRNGRQHEMGLGSLAAFNLAEARERARTQRQLLADGADPLALKRQVAQERVVETMRRRTFEEAAAEFIEAKRPGWKNERSTSAGSTKPLSGPRCFLQQCRPGRRQREPLGRHRAKRQ